MVLSDAQIERFSRQIILPQIGGSGQERLLGAAVALAGDGELARITGLYLAGAGVGWIEVHRTDGHRLVADLVDLDPAITARPATRPLPDTACEVLVACDLPLPELERAAGAGRPLIAAGTEGRRGWLVVSEPGAACACCAARAATAPSPSPSLRRPTEIASAGSGSVAPEPADGQASLDSATAGVVGSLAALSVVKLLLGLGTSSAALWLRFDAGQSTLTEHPITHVDDCPVCR